MTAGWDLDDLSVDDISVDMYVDDLSVYFPSVDDISVYFLSVDDISVHDLPVDNTSSRGVKPYQVPGIRYQPTPVSRNPALISSSGRMGVQNEPKQGPSVGSSVYDRAKLLDKGCNKAQ